MDPRTDNAKLKMPSKDKTPTYADFVDLLKTVDSRTVSISDTTGSKLDDIKDLISEIKSDAKSLRDEQVGQGKILAALNERQGHVKWYFVSLVTLGLGCVGCLIELILKN